LGRRLGYACAGGYGSNKLEIVPGAPDPLVSVVLPTHDRPVRLARALASVMTQSYRRLEILVVDDASAPPARAVVEEVAGADGRVRLLRLPEQAGAARARNAALARARGELVAFLDDDDTWEPDKVKRQVEVLTAWPALGMVTCDYTEVDEAAGTADVYRGPVWFTAEQVQWRNFPGSFSFVMVRRSLLGDTLRVDESFPSMGDWDLWLRCLRRAPAAVVAEPLVRHAVHGKSGFADRAAERCGRELFLRKHGSAMPPVCRAYLAAHLRMFDGRGWRHRGAVARSLATLSPRASALLVAEQTAHQLGLATHDPGLVARTMARLVGTDGWAGTARPLTAAEAARSRRWGRHAVAS